MATKKSKEQNRRSLNPRETLDIDKIVQTALTLLNESGLQQLTTRRLAEALGIRSASLYWHVRDKAELMQLLSESICGRLRLPDPNLPWQDQVLAFAREYRAVLLSIRDAAEILMETPPLLPNRLLFMEAMFKSLVQAGFPPEEIVMASMLVNDYVLSFVKNETRATNASPEETSRSRDVLSQLPPEQYPTLFRLAPYMASLNTDEHFEYGLHILLGSFRDRLENRAIR